MPPKRRRRPVKRRVNEHRILGSAGGTREWTRLRNRVVAEEPWCWLRLPGCTGRSQTADHIHLRKHRPDLTAERWNLRGACYWCNTHRKDTPVWEIPKLRVEMARRFGQRHPARALDFFKPQSE